MQTQRMKIFLHDEAPRLGCGWRWLNVQVGRKWVRLSDAMGRRCRMTKNQFAELGAMPAPETKKRRPVRAALSVQQGH